MDKNRFLQMFSRQFSTYFSTKISPIREMALGHHVYVTGYWRIDKGEPAICYSLQQLMEKFTELALSSQCLLFLFDLIPF